MNRQIRAAVMARSDGLCEACYKWAGEALHLDHARGRRNAESLESCWALCPICDHLKTTNDPSARKWVERFMAHCFVYGYAAEVALAETRLAVLAQKNAVKEKP